MCDTSQTLNTNCVQKHYDLFKEINGKFLPEQRKNFRFKYNFICIRF